ncbi:hypothetical protein PGQ11_006128 [Apiospora arundinis]|uniref:Uncharacterized protein n=1 Tax=Apiospora arundinis TaxID=335852 RepID=A0ABR2IRS6_9PEZI
MIHDKDDRYYLIAVARSRQEVMNHAHALLYAFEHFVLATSGMTCQALGDLIKQVHVLLKSPRSVYQSCRRPLDSLPLPSLLGMRSESKREFGNRIVACPMS